MDRRIFLSALLGMATVLSVGRVASAWPPAPPPVFASPAPPPVWPTHPCDDLAPHAAAASYGAVLQHARRQFQDAFLSMAYPVPTLATSPGLSLPESEWWRLGDTIPGGLVLAHQFTVTVASADVLADPQTASERVLRPAMWQLANECRDRGVVQLGTLRPVRPLDTPSLGIEWCGSFGGLRMIAHAPNLLATGEYQLRFDVLGAASRESAARAHTNAE